MKRWLWYLGVVIAVAALSGKASAGEDIGKLQPVQVVYVSCQQGYVVIETDTGDWGAGESLKDAMGNMQAAATGEIFLDTADHLLLSPECIGLLPALMEVLRPSCAVCLADGQPDLEQSGVFLQHHTPKVTLVRYRAGERDLQTLVTREGRMELVS